MILTFKDKAEDIKDKVLWLMLENYKDRVMQKALDCTAEETEKINSTEAAK